MAGTVHDIEPQRHTGTCRGRRESLLEAPEKCIATEHGLSHSKFRCLPKKLIQMMSQILPPPFSCCRVPKTHDQHLATQEPAVIFGSSSFRADDLLSALRNISGMTLFGRRYLGGAGGYGCCGGLDVGDDHRVDTWKGGSGTGRTCTEMVVWAGGRAALMPQVGPMGRDVRYVHDSLSGRVVSQADVRSRRAVRVAKTFIGGNEGHRPGPRAWFRMVSDHDILLVLNRLRQGRYARQRSRACEMMVALIKRSEAVARRAALWKFKVFTAMNASRATPGAHARVVRAEAAARSSTDEKDAAVVRARLQAEKLANLRQKAETMEVSLGYDHLHCRCRALLVQTGAYTNDAVWAAVGTG